MNPMPRVSLDMPAVDVTDLRKRYGQVEALAGLTMSVGRGEVFGFLGPNGAGKTTTVKLLIGLARPTSGSGRVLGAPLGDLEARRKVGYLPELFRYQPWLKAREVLTLHAELMGMNLYAITLDVGPYRVTATIATLPGFDPDRALARPGHTYIPLRDATIELLTRGDVEPARRPHLHVNRYAVEVVASSLMLGFFFPGAHFTQQEAVPVA